MPTKYTKPEKQKKEKSKPDTFCFRCDATGKLCNVCGESERACSCDEPDMQDCRDCKGTGK